MSIAARSLVTLALVAGACDAPSSPADLGDLHAPVDLAPSSSAVAARPYGYQVPAGYDDATPTPLVVVLHAFAITGEIEARYLGLSKIVDAKGFLLAYPEGEVNASGIEFWNASDAPASDGGLADDVDYLEAVVDDLSAHFNVDPKRIYLVGHSNGAFMAQYLACRRPERFAAVVSLAGGILVGVDCAAGAPVTLAEIHADSDDTIKVAGGSIEGMPYRPLDDVMAMWAKRDGCTGPVDTSAPPVDVDNSVAGAETTIARWTGCAGTSDVELWTMHGGSHIPNLTKTFAAAIYGWLAAHPRP